MELSIIILVLILVGLLCLKIKSRIVIESLSIIAIAVAFVGSLTIALKVADSGVYSPSTFFSIDSFGAIIMLIIGTVGLAISIYSVQYLRQETAKNIIGFQRVRQYFILLNLFLAAMFLAVSSSSPIYAWIFIEATTLSTAFLISFYNKPASTEAAWKYLIINSVGLLLGFFGALIYFTSINSVTNSGLVTWQVLLTNASHLDPMLAKIAFIFVLVGFGTKVGLAPMHTWLPDAHSKAPAPISALLSGVLLNVALIIVLRFKLITDASIGHIFSQNLLISFGVFSVLIASFIIFTQKNYKRLLAYSSIENMGIMALGFGFGGLGAFAAILHMIYHALVKSSLFMSAGNIFLKYSSTKIANVKGTITANPITSILFLLGFFIITGTPPFGVFLTKMMILSAGININLAISIMVLLFMTILFIGFFKHIIAIVFGTKPEKISTERENIWLILPPIALITIVIILSFYLPPFLYSLINNSAINY